MFSFKAVHGNLIHMSQDHDNGSFTIVDNYFWDVVKMLLDFARISLVAGEVCSIVIEQIGGVVHLLICSILALISNHSWFVSTLKNVRPVIVNNCNH